MSQIKDFAQVRADGNIAPSSLTVKEMIALGWGPSKVVALQWKGVNGTIEIKTPGGAHGIVVPGANFVAALYDADENNPHGRLVIIAADGSERSEVSNRISISGREYRGCYSWFEPALVPSSDCFGVVFETDEEIAFRCDVDANESKITDAVRSR